MGIKLHDLEPADGSNKRGKRKARGIGGKGGKTAGRGTKGQRRPDEVARLRGLDPEEFLPGALWQAYQESERGEHKPKLDEED